MTDGDSKHLYFMGICGTAMGSIAAAFADAGYQVTGSDQGTYDPMKSFLEGKGITALAPYDASNLPDDADIFVIGNAQSRGNPEVEAVLNAKRHFVSMPELLKEHLLRGRKNFIVTGTHGKTTTASLTAWVFESGGLNPNFVIGGLPGNFEQGARFTGSDHCVIEGDEYDSAFFDKRSKFIHYLPEVVIMNNVEFDHADIFKDLAAVKLAFERMIRLVPGNGLILINGDDQNCVDVVESEDIEKAPIKRVGFNEKCDARITDVEYGESSTTFTIEGETYEVPLNGEFNVRNAAMAICSGRFAGLSPDAIRTALSTFVGVKRRQEIRGVTDRGITVVDDFGHHPTAIREALKGMRHKFNDARIWAIFEPRSNTTRRNIFQDEIPAALSMADAVCVSEVPNPEKFAETDRLDSARVMATIRGNGVPAFYEKDANAIVERMAREAQDGDVVIVFSNGGFDGIHDKLLAAL